MTFNGFGNPSKETNGAQAVMFEGKLAQFKKKCFFWHNTLSCFENVFEKNCSFIRPI